MRREAIGTVPTASTTPLTLASLAELRGHARECVFWEIDPVSEGGAIDAAFEKEAWVSRVMLEWGVCGRILRGAEGEAAGHALYAPPGLLPRARLFPTSPVSSDAVLLTQLAAGGGNVPSLFAAVRGDLIRRGVRAVEAFGYRYADAGAPGPVDPADLVRAVPESAGPDCTCARCMIAAPALAALGFEEIAPHHRFPRFRLELGRDLGWKEEVEAALEGLLADAEQIPVQPRPARALTVVSA